MIPTIFLQISNYIYECLNKRKENQFHHLSGLWTLSAKHATLNPLQKGILTGAGSVTGYVPVLV